MVSHGCVRLAKPAELAKLLLAGDSVWTPAAIDAAITGTKTTRVRLSQPVSVFLLYWTAFASPNGQMSFRADPYKWDELLAAKVEGKGASAPVTVARN
jgi:murein L,D-transpeptidase YcbB/YkuD